MVYFAEKSGKTVGKSGMDTDGAGNYGAWQIDRYGEKLVLLEQVLCEFFR